MDPISAVFATYIDLVSSTVHKTMTDQMGLEVQAVIVNHNGMDVPYSYQMWKIRSQDVCSTYRLRMQKFSQCTIAAKSLFQQTCRHLQSNPQSDWKHIKLKNMYCHSANVYQPTLASIQMSEKRTPLQTARQECNIAVAKLMSSKTPENRKAQEVACEKYRKLQE
jgi:hypothetical protein